MVMVKVKKGYRFADISYGEMTVIGGGFVTEKKMKDFWEKYRVEFGRSESEGEIFFVLSIKEGECGDRADYYICMIDSNAEYKEIKGGLGDFYVRGNFTILAHGDGEVRAFRLKEWVESVGRTKITPEIARKMGEMIKKPIDKFKL